MTEKAIKSALPNDRAAYVGSLAEYNSHLPMVKGSSLNHGE